RPTTRPAWVPPMAGASRVAPPDARPAGAEFSVVGLPPPRESRPPVPAAVYDWFHRPDATSPAADPPQPAGYRLRREIGRGAMGVVFEAEQLDLKRVVAVKVLNPAQPLDADRLARFRAEGEAAARLSHPNIVEVHG